VELLSDEEKALRERQRVATKGFASFQISINGSYMLLPLSGTLTCSAMLLRLCCV
jgi:hypothetical protein